MYRNCRSHMGESHVSIIDILIERMNEHQRVSDSRARGDLDVLLFQEGHVVYVHLRGCASGQPQRPDDIDDIFVFPQYQMSVLLQ